MMNDRPPRGQAPSARAGLCDRCVHVRIVPSATGSRFHLCRLSAVDPAFPRYPRIPVVSCAGFAPASESAPSGAGEEPGRSGGS